MRENQDYSRIQDSSNSRETTNGINESPSFFTKTAKEPDVCAKRIISYGLLKRLEEMEQKKIEVINQPIYITELLVDLKQSYGEFEKENHNATDRAERMFEHIKILAKLAQTFHEEHYLKMNEPAGNKLTRLSMNEFALFTKDTPLTEVEFSILKDKINEIAKTLHQNVHLLLGTLAVEYNKTEAKNIAIYVQGGSNPKVHLCTKLIQSHRDLIYKNYSDFFFPSFELELKDATVRLPDKSQGSSHTAVNYNPVFVAELEEGQKFFICLDICATHSYKYSREMLLRQLTAVIRNRDICDYFPRQRSQVITSNTHCIMPDNCSSQGLCMPIPNTVVFIHVFTNTEILSMHVIKRLNKQTHLEPIMPVEQKLL